MDATSTPASRWLVRVRVLALVALVVLGARSGEVPGVVGLALGVAGLVAEVVQARSLREVRREAAQFARDQAKQKAELADRDARRARVERVIEGRASPEIVFQPVTDVLTGQVRGFEALSRFPVGRPDEWFAEAAAVGMRAELELKAIRRAVRNLERLPGASPFLALNASPATLLSDGLRQALADTDARRIVVELTEHVRVEDYEAVRAALGPLRARGVRLAVDHVGAGQASLRHIAVLQPDFIKLDGSFTRGLGAGAAEQHLVSALVGLGHSLGLTVVAEAVEDAVTLDAARSLGVHAAQGWHLGLPQPVELLRAQAAAVPGPRSHRSGSPTR
jgi:EAL domain-containing protein (putative c-di-GMP-specific phosphodiesterase class I)